MRRVAQTGPGERQCGAQEDAHCRHDDEREDQRGAVVLTTAPAQFTDQEKKPCGDAQALMPPVKSIPVINGNAVAVSGAATDIKFSRDHGLLAETIVTPLTHDPRVAGKNALAGKAMGPPFKMLFIYDYGAIRLPALMSLLIFSIWFLIHIFGLNRAEKRKLNPAMVNA